MTALLNKWVNKTPNRKDEKDASGAGSQEVAEVAAGRKPLRPDNALEYNDKIGKVAKSQKSQGSENELRTLARLSAEAAGLPPTPEYLDHVVRVAKLFETAEPERPCSKCGGRHFWRESLTTGPWLCYRCVRPLTTVWTDCHCLPLPR